MKKALLLGAGLMAAVSFGSIANAAEFAIDTKGAHASINFNIKHLGYSNLRGRFDKFEGSFVFDEANPAASSVQVTIDTNSVNSNHAERDKHLRSADFLNVSAHPTATFKSTNVEVTGDGTGVITGDFTLNGVTRSIQIQTAHIGGGKDPWGGFRQGFTGTTKIALADYGINFNLGPASKEVELTLEVEGIRK